jgi:Rps23 Pro-64 3,4-dihydroxylase Tpa1-like proline 4-hydroxylase
MENTLIMKRDDQSILDLKRWKESLQLHKKKYQTDIPYPHIVIDNFLKESVAKKAMDSFPKVKDEGWIHYMHVNEKKHGLNKFDLLPPFIQDLISELNKPEFVSYLSDLTGIPNLIPDDSLEGGGLHQSQRGGYLNIHADFTVHPHKRNWRRRANLLIYLNEDWKEEYDGHLELWSRDMKECVRRVSPIFNRCVVFNTDDDSFHGLPDPIQCPEDMTRKSIALYYYTEEEVTPSKRATNYRARPGDGIKSLWIYLDKQAIAVYNEIKGKLGLDDEFASKILNFFSRKKNK